MGNWKWSTIGENYMADWSARGYNMEMWNTGVWIQHRDECAGELR